MTARLQGCLAMKLLPEAMHFEYDSDGVACCAVPVLYWEESFLDMALTRQREKWYLVQWSDGVRGVVSARSILTPENEVKIGGEVIVRINGEQMPATVTGSSRDRALLEQQISPQVYEDPGPSLQQEEGKDFSGSESSWAPSEENRSSDDEPEELEEENKKIKMERYSRSYSRNTTKVLKPSNRVNALNVILNKNRKRKHDMKIKTEVHKSVLDRKSLPDSTRKNNSPAPNAKPEAKSVTIEHVLQMNPYFEELYAIIREMKVSIVNQMSEAERNDCTLVENTVNTPFKPEDSMIVAETGRNESYGSERSQSEESNRSDDNVLITNKYDNVTKKSNENRGKNKTQAFVRSDNHAMSTVEQNEWIPIGTGQTLLHKTQYRKVNWKSYTIATRTLLLALFPRKILATHSLTGKKSPAFQDKPPKMCLDPKIVTDVIIEITDRFRVRENLVRSIITTKCADECKMYKMRMQRKSLPSKKKDSRAAKVEIEDEVNITC